MLRAEGPDESKLLAPERAAVERLRAVLDERWQEAAVERLGGAWRDQVTAAAAIACTAVTAAAESGARIDGRPRAAIDDPLRLALWRAIDGASWVAPQLIAAALIADPQFEPRAAERLTGTTRRPPKTIGALVRAYTRCRARRMPIMAQLALHDRTMATEEARIGVRGVDGWLDYFVGAFDAPTSRSS